MFVVVNGVMDSSPSAPTSVPDVQQVVSRRCNTSGLNVLRVVPQNGIGELLTEHWVKGVHMGGFRTCYTVVILYHYLVYLVDTISSSVVSHYCVRAIGIDFPLRD